MATYDRKTSGMLPYASGDKIYGGGRSFPTMGPVDKMGYRERDGKTKARRNAVLKRMQANLKGYDMSPEALRKV